MHSVSKFRGLLLIALLSFCAPAGRVFAQDTRSTNIDVILLVDKSKSMYLAIEDVKRYIAGDIIASVLLPGDRLVIQLFYGQTERLFSGTIGSEADKVGVIELLRPVRGDGRFTDIGSALDKIDGLLTEMGQPERPKLVMLLTDERQEAPEGTKYFSKNYEAVHPYLTYTNRVDLGSFRAVIVGVNLGERIENASGQVLTFLNAPPEDRSSSQGQPAPEIEEAIARLSATANRQQANFDAILLIVAGVFVFLVLLLVILLLIRSRKEKEKEKEPKIPMEGSE